MIQLNAVANEYGLTGIRGNICKQDYLKCKKNSFLYYWKSTLYTYHDLSTEHRIFLKENFETCKEGRFDYCYAFIEAGLRDLADDGKLAYLIPYSVIQK